jgi:hypothetical protein
MFYIEAEETKVMARYHENGMVSVAAEFFPEGWGSIYVAEPALTPEVLREILLILEKHVFVRRGPTKFADVTYFGPNLFAVHAASSGERFFDLGATYSVQDLLDPQVGWQNKRFLPVPMRLGDTRVLSLTLSKETEQLPQGPVEDSGVPGPQGLEPATKPEEPAGTPTPPESGLGSAPAAAPPARPADAPAAPNTNSS